MLKKFFDASRRYFEEGGKLQRLYPFYESIESIFFAPVRLTQEGPHVRDSLDVKRFMALVLLALMPNLFFGIYNAGFQAYAASGLSPDFIPVVLRGMRIVLPMVVVTYIVGFFWETLFAVVRKHAISEGLFVSCMLFPLILPPTIPLWQVAVGISFGIVIGKEIFGGTGRNFLNPALTGRAFLFFAYPGQMSGDAVWTAVVDMKEAAIDALSSATPLVISALAEPGSTVEASLADAGYTFTKLFLGRYPGSVGATSALLCLAGAVFLILVGVASYRIIFGGVIGILFTGYLLNFVGTGSSQAWLSLNPFYHLVMGGAAFGIAYMATDPVSAPDLNTAKWVYGFFIGSLIVLIRVFNPAFPEGTMLAILFMNVFAPLIDHVAVWIRLRKRIPNV